MNVCGIIAEYNPFHNGHQYHLNNAKKQSEADYTVVVMSGDFVQRGTPAIMDKYTRTEAALRSGADLVLQLPTYYAAGSAEFFSSGAISLLDKLGVVTHLCFGSECGDVQLLSKLASIYVNEPKEFQDSLRVKLKSGLSFPVARAAALLEVYPEFSASLSVLSSPNNILGIEYIKALLKRKSSMEPLTITRSGAGYHDRELDSSFSSATAIRHAIENGISPEHLKSQIPAEATAVYDRYFADSKPVFLDDFSGLLYYKLLLEQDAGYSSYMDVSEDLSDRIRKNLYQFTTFSDFCNQLKTKEITYSRICRCLLHILLNIKKDTLYQYVHDLDYVPYARILGFRKSATPLLSEISKNASVPLISKLANADKILEGTALDMLKEDIRINDIYNSVRAGKNHSLIQNEYTKPIVIID